MQDKKISGETPEVLTEKLILAGQALLSQIADLKRQALLADFAALNTGVAQEVQTSLTKTAEGEAELAHTPHQEVRWLTFAIWQPGTMLCLKNYLDLMPEVHEYRVTSTAPLCWMSELHRCFNPMSAASESR